MRARSGTTRQPDIEIRSAFGRRVAQGTVCAVGGFLALIGTIALIGRQSPWAVLAAAALGVWIAYYYRLLNLAVVVTEDRAEVRNLFLTRRVDRAAVGAVLLGQSNVVKSPNQTVVLEMADGQRLPLDACARTTQSSRKARRVEDFHRRLASWSLSDSGADEDADEREDLAG